MLLYIHVPFCQQKCAYCAFYSIPLSSPANRPFTTPDKTGSPTGLPVAASKNTAEIPPARTSDVSGLRAIDVPGKEELLDQYCQTLVQELSLRTGEGNSTPVETIFFGGGTPSLLSARQIDFLLNAVQTRCSVSPLAEITIEANPESALRDNWLADIRAAGVNRLSLGIQSFHADDLALLGRCHSLEQSDKAINRAHQANFSSLSFDLMWGLPQLDSTRCLSLPESSARSLAFPATPASHVSLASPLAPAQPVASVTPPAPSTPVQRWLHTLTTALSYNPQHISAYGLILEEGTPLARQAEAGELLFPAEDEENAMYIEGIGLLAKYGLAQYEISNYALPGHQCRHNLGYWEGEDYLGLGPSAVSTLGRHRYANCARLEQWAEGVTLNDPACEKEILTPATLKEERLMLSLRLTRGIALADWEPIYGHPFQPTPFIRQMLADDLATLTNSHLALTPSGMLVSNAIISRLFEDMA